MENCFGDTIINTVRQSDHNLPVPPCSQILNLIGGKLVIGHAIHNDFRVLSYSHPASLTRDTSRFPPLNRKAGLDEKQVASLKRLTKAIFNREIQVG